MAGLVKQQGTAFAHGQQATIAVNGQVLFEDFVEPDPEFLIRNYLEHRDRKLLYVAEVKVVVPLSEPLVGLATIENDSGWPSGSVPVSTIGRGVSSGVDTD